MYVCTSTPSTMVTLCKRVCDINSPWYILANFAFTICVLRYVLVPKTLHTSIYTFPRRGEGRRGSYFQKRLRVYRVPFLRDERRRWLYEQAEHVSLSAHGIVLSTVLRWSCYRVATVVIKRALLPYNYEYSWVYKARNVEGPPWGISVLRNEINIFL